MTFASTDFLILVLVTLSMYWMLPRRLQNLQLIVTSLVFYGWIHPWWVLLVLYSAVLDYGCGRGMERWPELKSRFLALSVLGNLGLLAGFKYFDFFVGQTAVVLQALGLHVQLRTLELVLPIGISFYTFQTLSYSIDVYRKKIPACRDPMAFLLFVSYFPQLTMGPIGRAKGMFPQIDADRELTPQALGSGLSLALWGAFKKIVVADTLAGFVYPVLAQPSPSVAMACAAGLGASVMMFADFSGYTDIARGVSRLLGFELPINFRAPYLATTPSEWFARWHITFYQWMAEYVFEPVVGARWCRRWLVLPFVKPTPVQHVARGILVSMLLSGLWHGLQLNYLVWGGFFGVIQLGFFFGRRILPPEVRAWRHQEWVLRPFLLAMVIVGELLFQVPDTRRVLTMLLANPFGGTSGQWLTAWLLLAVTLTAALPMVAVWALQTWGAGLVRHPVVAPVRAAAFCLAAWMILVFYQGEGSGFQYFQF